MSPSPAAGRASAMDRALLRRFEPIIRYTRGEKFFPMRIEPYLAECSLWQQRSGREANLLAPEGELTMATLAEPRQADFGTVHFLKFITPLNVAELASYRLQQLQEDLARPRSQEVFRAGRGRLARVGYGSRFVDALFQLSLLARGRVPGDTAAAAALAYERLTAGGSSYSSPKMTGYHYYGRVVHENSWIVLQYWFFYAFNNWRSGFYGANDHEGDWEMLAVYLSEEDVASASASAQATAGAPGSGITPQWVAYAAHDYSGDDLRRRWDDPELEKVGEHPVVYAGAGSHASHFAAGDYLAEIELPFLARLVGATEAVKEFWRRRLQRDWAREDGQGPEGASFNIFRIPFVDYARGDGVALGPGTERPWSEPQLLEPAPGWVMHYRGLWGLYTRDPFSGENAPAGPMYERDGTVRKAWYDPLGWAGLDKVPPPGKTLAVVLQRRTTLETRRAALAVEIEAVREKLVGLGIEARAMREQPHMEATYRQQAENVQQTSQELDGLRAEYAADKALLEALDLLASRLRAGQRSPVRAHIQRPLRPLSEQSLRFGRFAEVWAAVSIGLLLLAFVTLALFAPQYLVWGLVALLVVFFFIEASFRRQLPRLVTSFTVVLAVVAALVLLYEFFWTVVVGLVLSTGAYLMWENLRELWA